MKIKIFYLAVAIFFLCGKSVSQIYTPINPTVYGQHNLRVKSDSALHLPQKDSVKYTADTTAQIFYRPADSSLWVWSKAAGFFKIAKNSSIPSSGWSLTGNSSTIAGTNFLGTNDNVGLMFKVNGIQAAFLDYALGNASWGYQSMINNSTGSNNTASGITAMLSNVSGNHNSAFGEQSLYSMTSGEKNVAIGYSAGKYYISPSNKLFVDGLDRTDSAGARNKSLIYGEFNATAASQKLYVNGQLYLPYIASGYGTKQVRVTPSTGETTYSNSSPDWYDIVVDGGADATGVVDATSIIQNAINAGYKSIYIPTGVFKIASRINMKDSVTIRGDGRASSVLKMTSDTSLFWCSLANGGSSCLFKDFGIRGTYSYQSSTETNQVGIRIDSARRNIVENVAASLMGGWGVYVTYNGYCCVTYAWNATQGNAVNNSYFDSSYGGVKFGERAEYDIADNITATENYYGVYINGGNNRVNNSNSSYNQYGIWLSTGSNNGHGAVTGSTFNHNRTENVYVDGTARFIFSGNSIMATNGITINAATDIIFYGNAILADTVKVLSSTGTVFDGTYFWTASKWSVTGTAPTVRRTNTANAISLQDVVNAKQFDITHTAGLVGLVGNATATDIKVGIGTSSPTAMLHVNGSVKINKDSLAITTGKKWKVMIDTATGTLVRDSTGISGSGTTNYVPKWTPNGTTLGNSQIYDDGTSVSIGTTTNDGYGLYVKSAGSSGLGLKVKSSLGYARLEFQNNSNTGDMDYDANGWHFYQNIATNGNIVATSTTNTKDIGASGATFRDLWLGRNATIGGTLSVTGTTTLSSLTAGSVPYVGTAGLISQDNANFFWDAGNARLGIGTASPPNQISAVSSTSSSSATGFYVANGSSAGYANMTFRNNAANAQVYYTGSTNATPSLFGFYQPSANGFAFSEKVNIGALSQADSALTVQTSARIGTNLKVGATLGVTGNGAVSTPAITGTGTWYSGGSATTTKPYLLIEPTGTTSTGWNTSGTGLGINAASGFAGIVIDAKVAGSSIFKVSSVGGITSGSIDATNIAASGYVQGDIIYSGKLYARSGGSDIIMANTGASDFGRLQLGGTTSSFPAIARNGTGIDIKLADNSDFTNLKLKSMELKETGSTYMGWTNRTVVYSPADGVLTLTKYAGTDFDRLQIGGASSSYPALKRNGTDIEFKLADNSAYTGIQSLYDRFGSGSPESVVTAPVGAVYHRTDGGAGTSFYVKESGSGNTGWVAK